MGRPVAALPLDGPWRTWGRCERLQLPTGGQRGRQVDGLGRAGLLGRHRLAAGERAVTPLRTYYRGTNLVTMRDEVAKQNSVYHFDHQGSVQCLTTGGAVTSRWAGDAWGV